MNCEPRTSFAAIDLGTNTFHLLIVSVDEKGRWKKLFKERVTVKLGQGGIDSKHITPIAYKRGLRALEKFSASLKKFKIDKVFAFGTAALRTAKNGSQFLEEVNRKFGIKVKLITGDEEADLIYTGVREVVKFNEERVLVMDIGGGSVEFIIADQENIYWKRSYKLGAALLLDKFKPGDRLSKPEISEINNYVSVHLKSLLQAFDKFKPVRIIGSAGSFETFASMLRAMFKDAGSHYGKTEHPIKVEHFNRLYRVLIVSNKEQRMKMKGLIKMRVDMIVIAAMIFKFVLDSSKIKNITLSAYALKEGAVSKIIQSTYKRNK